jgi:hypothetical protein
MSEQFANLGTAAVLDAKNLVVGSHVKMGNEVFVVSRIVDDLHVYFRPLTKLERVQYFWSHLSPVGKCLICGMVLSMGIVLLKFLH